MHLISVRFYEMGDIIHSVSQTLNLQGYIPGRQDEEEVEEVMLAQRRVDNNVQFPDIVDYINTPQVE